MSALRITHSFVSQKADGSDDSVVRPSNWNADHEFIGLPDDATKYLDGTGNFSVPSGSGGGSSPSPIGPSIQSIIFDKTDYIPADGGVTFKLTFDKEVAWTGLPVIYMNAGTGMPAFINSSSPATTLSFVAYLNPPTLNFTPGELSWGSPAQYSYIIFSVSNATITFIANTAGVAGNAISMACGTLMQAAETESGATPVVNTPLSISVSGNVITIIGATDSSGNLTTTGTELLAAWNGSDGVAARALVTITLQMADNSQPIAFSNQYTGFNAPDGLPPAGNLGSGYDSNDGAEISSFPGYTAPTFTYSDNIGTPDVTFTGPTTISNISLSAIVGTVNNQTGSVLLQTGTTGSDFNIFASPNSGVVQLNIPTASADNRGLLSAADWTAFHNVSGVSLGDDNTWTGTNAFQGTTQLGDFPSCDNAKVTVYQTMNSETNSSMVDMVGTGGDNMSAVTVLNVLPTSNGNITDTLAGVYVKSRIYGGTINTSAAIKVETPDTGESSVAIQYGILVNDQSPYATNSANIYSAGSGSKNIFEGKVGIGTAGSYPLTITYTPNSSGYGNVSLDIETASTEAGLLLNNTSADGRGFTLISTGTGSSLQTGAFVIGDATNSTGRLLIDKNGNVGIGNMTPDANFDINNTVQFYTTSFVQPAAAVLATVGTVGTTTYGYKLVQVGLYNRASLPSVEATITGPDTLDTNNYVTVTTPNVPGQNYAVYRTTAPGPGGGCPLGFLTVLAANTTYNDTNPLAPAGGDYNGPLPVNTDRSVGITVQTPNGGSRSLYCPTNDNGLILGGIGNNLDAELRIVTNTGWTDTANTTYCQLQNAQNNNVSFLAGTYGVDSVMDRLQFSSFHTTFTNATQSATPVPSAIVEIWDSTNDTVDFIRFLAPNQATIARVTSTGQVQGSSFLVAENTVTYSTLPIFDCSLSDLQTITLTGDAAATVINLVVGQKVTFIIAQDGSGGHAFTWPVNVQNPVAVNTAINSFTVQEFISPDGANLVPVSPTAVAPTVTDITSGTNITVTPSGTSFAINSNVSVAAGTNVSVGVSGGTYTVSAIETVQTLSPGINHTIDWSQGSIAVVPMNGDTSITQTNAVPGIVYTVVIQQGNGNDVTWDGSFKGASPIDIFHDGTVFAHTVNIQRFICYDNSGNIYAVAPAVLGM